MKSAAFFGLLFAGAALAAPNPTSAATNSKPTKSACTKKTTTTTSPAGGQTGVCNADNCARAVTGTYQGLASENVHRSDCSSFFQCTSYPATSTVYVTATVYPITQTNTVYPVTATVITTDTTVVTTDATATEVVTVIDPEFEVTAITIVEPVTVTAVAERRFVTTSVPQFATSSVSSAPSVLTTKSPATGSVVCPTSVPTYASACSGTARFSSACSCWGVTHSTTAMTTPTTTVTVTATGQTTVTLTETATVTDDATAISDATVTTIVTDTVLTEVIVPTTVIAETMVTVSAPMATGNAYCENGQPVNGLSASCTTVGCSTTNLRIEGASGTIYEGTILAGPRNITTASGGTHLCDGTNNGANPVPFENGITTIDAAGQLCGFSYDGTFSPQFDDFFIQRIGDTQQTGDDFWGILLNYAFTPAGGCETEVRPTDELLWAFNAFNVNYFLRVEPTQTPVVLAPGQSTTFTVQGTDGNGDPFVNIAGASFNGQTSDGNGNVPFTAPTTPGTYRYKATRSDSIRSNAVTIVVQG